ncbi:PREDICTED: uncharacterized protein LOC105127199 isoform X2 [Populus euphratica]|uniref:Uncharacterized protein LOC105127199 isoform X2 n=1 Tax=Populus euphratica TaxID=75702 RepID=A0AAJ6UB83_POPEU|nr:PREDICTED: uncharacterized protein LOC105127199 isoform X2 [Populus euphratica]
MGSTKYHQKSFRTMHSHENPENSTRIINKLQAEMAEISKQHEEIKQGQKEMRERFEEMDSECEQLKKETEDISHASDNVQLRLNIMLDILKARQEDGFAKVSYPTGSLRRTC